LPPPLVLIQFDDTLPSTDLISYMSAKSIPGTAYLITNGLPSESLRNQALAAGWVLGNHIHHQDLRALTVAEQEAALTEGYNELLAVGITTGQHVAYPMGWYNADTLTAMANAGMLTGRTTNYGTFLASNAARYELKSIQPASLDDAKSTLDTAMDGRQILILLFHSPPAWFNDVIDYIDTNNYPCGTIADLQELLP
jgi:peptidoglycan/xylan/chitin deacetylase (PgdA/CDA1 family)